MNFSNKNKFMKTILTTAIFTLLSILTFSQNSTSKPSRQETESWIIEKLNNYIEKEEYHSSDILDKSISTSHKNIKFTLNTENIIISSDVTKTTSNRYLIDGIKIDKETYTEKTTIPLKNITNKIFIKDGYIVFESNYNSFTTRNSDGYTRTNNWYGTRIKSYEEANFAERFNKAMNHLLTFVKKTKSTELF